MSAQGKPQTNGVVVPGPSRTTEGLTRVAVDAIRHAVEGLQGAADVFRSLGR